jgi:hypothetical protein
MCPIMSREPREYALELANVLSEAGWQVMFNYRAIFTLPPSELKVWVHSDVELPEGTVTTRGDVPDRAIALYDALKLAGLPVGVQFNTSVAKDDVQLIVGFKP